MQPHSALLIIAILSMGAVLAGQDQSVEASLNTAWTTLRLASERCLNDDQNLELDLFRVSKETMLVRINSAEQAALKLVSSRDQYYKAMAAMVKRNITSLDQPTGSLNGIALLDMKNTVKRELEMIHSEQADLEKLILQVGNESGQALLRIWAEKERDSLEGMHAKLDAEY